MNSAKARATELSVVIPVYNGERVLAATISQLTHYLTSGHSEIIIVENGSSDRTLEVANECAVDNDNLTFRVLQSEQGMGNALRCGIQSSTGTHVLLTADDLPFGVDDLEQFSLLTERPTLVIGSKAHRDSVTPRGFQRALSTMGFRALRQLVLNSKIGDSQGTLIAQGDWLRQMLYLFDDPGFLFSTQVVFAAEQQNLQVIEVPVRLAPDDMPAETTIKMSDIAKMAKGILSLRARRQEFCLLPQGSATL